MPEPAEVSVRRLPGGVLHPAVSVAGAGHSRIVEFGPSGVPSDLALAAAVEIVTPDRILLGTVFSRGAKSLEVQVEHALDRSRVAALQRAWGRNGLVQ